MGRLYFSRKEINEVNDKNMKVVEYEEFYKPGTRHGFPDAIIVRQVNVRVAKMEKKIKKKIYYYDKRKCPHCLRMYNAQYLKCHIQSFCKNYKPEN